MSLTLRSQKGSPLTFGEMDGNLAYLEELAQQGGGGGGSSYYDNGNSSQNTVIDWSRANLQELGIDNNPTLSFTGATAGQKLTLLLKRLAGESKKTITWANGVFWRDGKEFDLKAVGGVLLDENFEIGEGFDSSPEMIVIQPDGKILVGGNFTQFNGDSALGLVRLNPDGSRDTGFGIGEGFNGPIRTLALRSNGKILAGGSFSSFDGSYSHNNLVQLNQDGSLDEGFDIGGGFNSSVEALLIQPDGKILVGGFFTEFNEEAANRLIRLNINGSRDLGFETSAFNNGVYSLTQQSNGKIIVGGEFTDFNRTACNYIARLNTDGSFDNTFNVGSGFNSSVYSLVTQPDDKILVGGSFQLFDGEDAKFIVRLNPDGSRDVDFMIGEGFNNTVYALALQPSGKILVGGSFTSFDDNYSNNGLVNLNQDGSLDDTFVTGEGFNDTVYTLALQPNGGILAGGSFTSFDGSYSNNGILRLLQLVGDIYTPISLYYTGTKYIGNY